jgi:hypothetical protein
MGMSRGWCVAVGTAFLLTAGVVVAGGAATPEAAFKEFQAALTAKDGAKAWKLLSTEAKKQIDRAAAQLAATLKDQFKKFEELPAEQQEAIKQQFAKQFGMSVPELLKLDGKGLFAFSIKNAEKLAKGAKGFLDDLPSATLENVKVNGDKATGTVKTKTKSEPLDFVKEGDSWKITPPK